MSLTSNSTTAGRTHTTAASVYTQSPSQRSSPAYANVSLGHAQPTTYGPTSAPHGPGSMIGGPVLPAISELHRHADPTSLAQFRSLYSGAPGPILTHQGPSGQNVSPPLTLKRQASQTPLLDESPAKKQSKWTPEEDNLTIELRGQGMKWDDIAKRLPGRSSISCRLRYQNYLEKRAIWDEEKKNKLARLYARFKDQMWQKVATEMGIPWRSAESMHWQLGEQEMSARANAPVFQLHPSATATGLSSPSEVPVVTATAPHGFTPANTTQLQSNPPPGSNKHHQSPPTIPQGSHGYHYRSDSGSGIGRTRNSSFSRRRADQESRSSVPPHFNQPLPQIRPQSADDMMYGTRTTPALIQFGIKREAGVPSYMDIYQTRRRDDEAAHLLRQEMEGRNLIMKSPDRLSQRSGTGSIQSMKRESDEVDRTTAMPSPPHAPFDRPHSRVA